MLFHTFNTDEVAQYSEGHRITSYFSLGKIKDGDQQKDIWLWTTAERLGDEWLMQVQDNGIGIAPEDIARVVRPFEQVENVLSRSHGGTGLGLPLTSKLTELHGGEFTIESQVAQGTTVTVHLPAARLRAAPETRLLKAV